MMSAHDVCAFSLGDVRVFGFDGTAKRSGSDLLDRVRDALAELSTLGVRISFPMVADAVGVAKSTLYRNPEATRLIEAAREASLGLPRRQDADASELESLRQELAALQRENEQLRAEVAALRPLPKVEYRLVRLREAA